jgi:hypothetical protein
MAVIGSFGKLVFSVSDKYINTINNVKWDSSARYSEHSRHLRDPLVEFTGNNNDKFSLSMEFSVFLGVNPLDEITKVLQMERRSEAHFLIIGTKPYGKNKWVITAASIPLERFDNRGNILIAKADVNFLAYPVR